MQRSVLILFCVMGLFSGRIQAQDQCQSPTINTHMDALLFRYMQARQHYPVGAAHRLQNELDALLAECAAVEVIPEPLGLRANTLQSGLWRIYWGESSKLICPDSTVFVMLPRQPFFLEADDRIDRFTVTDNYAWPALMLTAASDGSYGISSTRLLNESIMMIFEYRVTIASPQQIDGLFTAHIPTHDCRLWSEFQMTLVDENVICMIEPNQIDVNLRSGPGTAFTYSGTLSILAFEPVNGQAQAKDGFIWWRLRAGSWVRSDLVSETGDCENVPVVSPT